MKGKFIADTLMVSDVPVPVVKTRLSFSDNLGTVMVRWGINRDNYNVSPGLYAVGTPDSSSDVFVTSNYKLTFDIVRRNLHGVNGWILVLDTRGINVWCAAGKKTFSTRELVARIKSVSLDKIVNHKRIILPQLGATGVAAHKVKEQTGFNVHWGPVRAVDIKKFIEAGYRADRDMRKVRFQLWDRAKLIPVDLFGGKLYLLAAIVLLSLLSLIGLKELSVNSVWPRIVTVVTNLVIAYFAGIVLTPLLLPYIPGRSFSLKGFISGAFLALILIFLNQSGNTVFEMISWVLLITAISSFMAMNFTGSSTFTSLSGVKKEMKIAVPLQIAFSVTGIILFVTARLLN